MTGGEDNGYSKIKDICESMKNNDYKLYIIGFQNDSKIQSMNSYASEVVL